MMTHNKRGFTIVELMIATMVFSVILLSAATALIQMGKLYYKGVVTNRMQETTRSIVDQVGQQLQFSKDNFVPSTGGSSHQYIVTNGIDGAGKMTYSALCIGDTRYSFRINTQVNSGVTSGEFDPTNLRGQHGLWRDTAPGICVGANLSTTDPTSQSGAYNGIAGSGQELLPQNARLSSFDIKCTTTPSPNSTTSCTITLGVIYGDNELLEPDPHANTPTHCQSIVGSQWCASSSLTTTVARRLLAE